MPQEEAPENAAPVTNGTPAAAPVAVPAASTSLPPGWFEALDPAYNHPYWYCSLHARHELPMSRQILPDFAASSDACLLTLFGVTRVRCCARVLAR